jgi:hypothetical protein
MVVFVLCVHVMLLLDSVISKGCSSTVSSMGLVDGVMVGEYPAAGCLHELLGLTLIVRRYLPTFPLYSGSVAVVCFKQVVMGMNIYVDCCCD